MERKRFDWWQSKEPHDDLIPAARHIERRDASRKESYLRSLRLYGAVALTDFADRRFDGSHERLGLNVVKAVVQSVVAALVRSLPRSRVLTSGGNWSLRRKARNLERFLDGQRHANNVRQLAGEVALDYALLGTPVVKVYPDFEEKRVCIEHVHPGELFVDHLESIYRKPRTMYQRKYIARETLMVMFPKSKAKILAAQEITTASGFADTTAEMIEVWESWHLGYGEEKGRHVICIEGETLFSEDWEDRDFPFVVCRWDELPWNFWGEGLGEQLTGIQIEINRVLQKIQKAIHLVSVPRVFLEAGSKVQKAHINNQIGAIVTYTGQKPIIDTPNSTHPEVFEYLWSLWGKAFEIAGVAQLASAGATPAGLESGEAIRQWSDTQSARFAKVFADWEDFWVRVDEAVIAAGKRLAKVHPNFATNSPKDKWTTETIRWKDVDMAADQYVLRCYPASSLPSLPSGKLAFVSDMINAGMIDPMEGKRLLDFPDLEGYLSLDRAAHEAVDAAIEKMLDDGEFIPPEPFFDLALTLKTAQSAYLRASVEGAPEDRLELLRQFMAATKRLIDQASLAQQPMQGPMEQSAAAIQPPGPDETGAMPTAPTGNEAIA